MINILVAVLGALAAFSIAYPIYSAYLDGTFSNRYPPAVTSCVCCRQRVDHSDASWLVRDGKWHGICGGCRRGGEMTQLFEAHHTEHA